MTIHHKEGYMPEPLTQTQQTALKRLRGVATGFTTGWVPLAKVLEIMRQPTLRILIAAGLVEERSNGGYNLEYHVK